MADYKLGVNTPIYPSVTYGFGDPKEIATAFALGLSPGQYLYGRFGHPNYEELRIRLAHMECGEDALLFASGIAATFALFFAKLSIGDHIVVSSRIYGGTRGQLAMLADKLRLKVSIVDITDHAAVARACRKNTKLLFAESVSNPEVVVSDISAIARICHSKKRDILLVIDNTFTPLIMRPLLLGADVVMHSLTKYVNGNSDAMGGALVGKKAFMDALAHPSHGEAPLIGGVLHPPVAQEMANRFAYIEYRVREASERAYLLAQVFARAGLRVHYPMLAGSTTTKMLHGMEKEMGGGVLSLAFPSEAEGARFVEVAQSVVVNDPLLGPYPLAIAAVSLGSPHTYLWCTTEARVQSQVKKWSPLPFAPVPYGFVRVAVGYGGSRAHAISQFENVLRKLGYLPQSMVCEVA
jgi:methionine-gamma-lyase